ncbi:hypothetical protein EDB81DRAFT_656351 [Dactylonectria macrodidyma]|uniref:J domain-containing protein n=1 Tax=Dactylonectria macrodidyma TaxID=307937 RepID=A0A9P9EGQ1_9HYPO|nr:hypothetical protein EDB81DRAFT_656351 [Dactylonectria macrodidyma]
MSLTSQPVESVHTTGPATAKTPQGGGGLRTPSPTPGLELERIKAEKARKATEEIKRILECEDPAEILKLPKPIEGQDADELEVILAWREIGCMIHPDHTEHKDATTAYKKLQTAAKEMGLDATDQEDVDSWDGKAEFDPPTTSGQQRHMDEDEVPQPPARVLELYTKATPLLYALGENPHDPAAHEELKTINEEIREANKKEELSPLEWLIPINELVIHYIEVNSKYGILKSNATDQDARSRISMEKKFIDEIINRNHLPEAWTVLTADEFVAQQSENVSNTTSIDYPWRTGKGMTDSLIVGVRKSGRGTQVCVERQEGGTLIRRLESASEVGLLEVQNYMNTNDFKNLAEGQSLWSHQHRDDFEELLWVTKSQTMLKNTASRRKDPAADCCVKFRKKGIHILTVSSLSKVLGPTSARRAITRVCERDGFLPPWEAEPVSTYYDKTKLEKNPVKRREMRDQQALENRDIKEETNSIQHLQDRIAKLETSGEGQLQARVEKMEKRFDTMETSMNELKDMFKQLMATLAR